ncbi:MAG: hypothetical protein HC934_14120 [Acaryochloridaceae cyanobacterium SU_2_1]|nr:hypothetical protein [Acaryochloridaceae cyanobacterium SU_2_1]
MGNQTISIGQDVMRHLLRLHWDLLHQQQVEDYCLQLDPNVVECDGCASQKVVCPLGILPLQQQVCFNSQTGKHILLGNDLLPEHHGTIITCALQGWACLFPQDLPFRTVERLLSWQTQQPKVISRGEVSRLVQRHGEMIRAAEAKEAKQLAGQGGLSEFEVNLIEAKAPRHRAAWPVELTAAEGQTLADPKSKAPEGITHQDWQRVLETRAGETACWPVEKLRRLGAEIQPEQTIAVTNDILVQPQASKCLTLRVARIATVTEYWYVSGTGSLVFRQLSLLLSFCSGFNGWVPLLGDGAKWLCNYFERELSEFTQKELLLDCYHPHRKCADFAEMIASTCEEKKALKNNLHSSLWVGRIGSAIKALEACYLQAKNEQKFQKLIGYLKTWRPYVVNYNERRLNRQYIGSAHAKEACELVVVKGQKNKGVNCSEATADALAAMKTVMLNQAWDLFWVDQQILPLATNP